MAETHYICDLSSLDDPGTRGFELPNGDGEALEGFVVRRGDSVYAYRDSCPHTGIGLAWLPHEYLDLDKMFIECGTHGALFTLDAGYCVSGPCAGRSLTPIQVTVEDGRVLVSGIDET